MTETLRELEIAHRADPTDERARLRFYDETARRHDLALTRDPGVYVHASGVQLVYVPGGEVECSDCRGSRVYVGRPCAFCDATGKPKVGTFFVGRFPVTHWEFLGHQDRIDRYVRVARVNKKWQHHPVVNVSLGDALDFCAWAGAVLRLPSEQEWRWAALGGLAAPKIESRSLRGLVSNSALASARWRRPADGRSWALDRAADTQDQAMRRLRCDMQGFGVFPWGPEPPTPERCVWAGHPNYGPRSEWDGERGFGRIEVCGSTAPVVVIEDPCPGQTCTKAHDHRGRLVPARPEGASWCGAHDMAGNVFELVDSGLAFGGSFRSVDMTGWPRNTGPVSEARDDVGFRVALSVRTA